MNIHFSKRRHTNGQQAHEKMLNITTHQGNGNQTTVRYSLIPVRMVIIKKITNNKCWQGCRKKGTLVRRWWEGKLVQPLWKTIWKFLKKLKTELPYNLAIPLLGFYPKKMITVIRKDICILMFTAARFTTAKIWKQPKCPSIEEWTKKMWYTRMQWNITQPEKKNEILPFETTWMDLEVRQRQVPYDFIYMWNLKNKTNEQT